MPVCGLALLACVSSLDTGIIWRMELQIKSNEIDGNLKCCLPSLPFLYYAQFKKSNCILCFIAMIYKVNVARSAKCFHWDPKSKLQLLQSLKVNFSFIISQFSKTQNYILICNRKCKSRENAFQNEAEKMNNLLQTQKSLM